jgi:hypothetical protein
MLQEKVNNHIYLDTEEVFVMQFLLYFLSSQSQHKSQKSSL